MEINYSSGERIGDADNNLTVQCLFHAWKVSWTDQVYIENHSSVSNIMTVIDHSHWNPRLCVFDEA